MSRYDYRKDMDRIARDLHDGAIPEQVRTAMDGLIAVGIDELRKEGRHEQADRIEREWQGQARAWVLSAWDLGDHAPLFDWLKKLYDDMETLLSRTVMNALRLTDLRIINHALPVVLNPWSRQWDKVEWRKHFVPLAGVIAYWGTLWSCRALVDWNFLRPICGPAARLARGHMVSSLGPWLSDRIYRQLVRRSD